MQFIMKHFPFLFIIIFVFSCDKNNLDKEFESEYTKIREYALYLEDQQKIDSAFYYLNLIPQKFPDEIDAQVYAKLEQARLYQIICDFAESETIVTEAMAINEDRKYDYYLYNMLGTAYQEQSNYSKAIDNYQLAFNSTYKDKLKIVLKNNIGVVYLEQGNYSKTIQILEPLLKLDTLKKHREDYARIIDNLGFAYLNLGKKRIAYHHLLESLRIKDSIDDEYEKLAPLMHLARFFKDSITSESNRFALNAYNIATKVNSPDDRLEALDILIRNSFETRQFKKYYDKFSSLKDSIEFVRQTAKNQFANIKYNSDKAIKEKEKERVQKERLGISLILFMIISTLIFFLIRSKNKREKLKIAYTTETRISKRLHDELANDVFNTMTFIETQDLQNKDNKESILRGLDVIYDKARNISKQTSGVKTGKDFGNLLNEMLMSYKSDEVNIIKKGSNEINWELIRAEKQIEIHRVLQELLVNMKKYSKAEVVVIGFKEQEKSIQISYSDNGVGFEKEKITKNGLQNVENRIHSIKGTIIFESEINKGVKINIEFPK